MLCLKVIAVYMWNLSFISWSLEAACVLSSTMIAANIWNQLENEGQKCRCARTKSLLQHWSSNSEYIGCTGSRYVTRMNANRIPKQRLFEEQPVHKPKNDLKEALNFTNINDWEFHANDRTTWQKKLHDVGLQWKSWKVSEKVLIRINIVICHGHDLSLAMLVMGFAWVKQEK